MEFEWGTTRLAVRSDGHNLLAGDVDAQAGARCYAVDEVPETQAVDGRLGARRQIQLGRQQHHTGVCTLRVDVAAT